MNKTELRNYAKEIRKTLNKDKLSCLIQSNLFSLSEWKNAKSIFCYYSVQNEVKTENLFELSEKNWFLPKVQDKNLLVCPNNKKYIQNKFCIPEPTSPPINPINLDLIIVPALAADRNGFRLGYGGGYYDRLFATLKNNTKKVILLYSDLLFDSIYPEEYDEKCDIIVTDKEILKINC